MNEYPNLEALADGRVENGARIGDYPLLRSEAKAVLDEVTWLRETLQSHIGVASQLMYAEREDSNGQPYEADLVADAKYRRLEVEVARLWETLPATYYAGRRLGERIKLLVDDWRTLTKANQMLEADLERAKKEAKP